MVQNHYLPESPSAHFLDPDWPARPLAAVAYKHLLNLRPRVVATQEEGSRRWLERTEPDRNQTKNALLWEAQPPIATYGWTGGSSDEPAPGSGELPAEVEPSAFFGLTSAVRSRLMERKLSPGVT